MKIHPTANYLAIGTHGRSMYKINLNEVTGLSGKNNTQPNNFTLFNNYPNPFNPSTTIKFRIQKSEFISLNVYDIIGNEISTLVKEQKSPGTYKIEFDGKELSSGVYFYSITMGKLTETKKMMLMK